jgi:hypothetical protein
MGLNAAANRVREALGDSADNLHAQRGFRRFRSRGLFSEKPRFCFRL